MPPGEYMALFSGDIDFTMAKVRSSKKKSSRDDADVQSAVSGRAFESHDVDATQPRRQRLEYAKCSSCRRDKKKVRSSLV
jgi:hypothetical protein